MARIVEETRTYEDKTVANQNHTAEADHAAWTGARFVWLIAGILEALLAMRVILSLLGANRASGFADFIYTVTQPFVAPFFGLFNYQMQYGVVRFEFETLVAMAVYAFIAWIIARLMTIGTHTSEDV